MLTKPRQLGPSSKLSAKPKSGPWAGKKFGVELEACPNPVCRCGDVTLFLLDESGARLGDMLLDIYDNCLVDSAQKITRPLQHELARQFVKNLSRDDWDYLGSYYLTIKRRTTERIDPKTAQVEFPGVAIETTGEYVAYGEILPYGDQLMVSADGEDFLIDDQYCVRAGCACTEAVVTFITMNDRERAGKDEHPAIFVNYKTGKCKVDRTGNVTAKSPTEVLDLFLEEYPTLFAIMAKRRHRLADLYAEYRKRHQKSQPEKSTKTGPNEPCLCGSGKKFKKCCRTSGLSEAHSSRHDPSQILVARPLT